MHAEKGTTFVETKEGMIPKGPGWYVLNAADAVWRKSEKFGEKCLFEGETLFPNLGINLRVLQPGQPACHYHAEEEQEDFLILQGTCRVILEEQEVNLRAWDFIHCPAGKRHVFVGAGDAPCVILMVGSRTTNKVTYRKSKVAAKYGAESPVETDSPQESYASYPTPTHIRGKWPLTK